MQTCSVCHVQSPDAAPQCANCQADLSQLSETALALKRIQANPRVNYLHVAVAHDCCPACRDAEGAYAKDQAPRLPIEGCSHNLGCRCMYQPVLAELYP
ncbi:MAG: hypothetical protein PHS96_03160 [Anaerolineales bacterium]|nr:hypothetical protein [Anaerolineales bacterium]